MLRFFFISCPAAVGLTLLPAALHAQGKGLPQSPVTLATTKAVVASSAPVLPSPAKPAVASLVLGSWSGSMPIPGKVISVGLVIAQQGSGLKGTLDIPGGTARQRPLQANLRGDTLRLHDATLGVMFTCIVSPDGQQLTGTCDWGQLFVNQSLTFHRGLPTEGGKAPRGNRSTHSTKWESGELENGQPVGVWNYYQQDAAGNYALIRSYDHTARKLMFARPENAAFDAELSPGHWERTVLTQSPWFIGRHDALTLLHSRLTYPPMAAARRTEGKVYVTFAVDTLGRVSDHKVLKGLGNGCDEEALRVARTIPDTWTPGRLGTRAVAARQTIMFAFKLQ